MESWLVPGSLRGRRPMQKIQNLLMNRSRRCRREGHDVSLSEAGSVRV